MPVYRTAANTPAPPPVQAPEPELALPGLPALAKLAKLAAKITLIADSREQCPLTFTRLPCVRDTLRIADYSIAGLTDQVGFERKSLIDLCSSVAGSNRERFERELQVLRGYRLKRLIVIGSREEIASGRYYSKINPAAVLASLDAFSVRYELPVIHVPTPEAAAYQIEEAAYWFAREVIKNANDLLRGCSTSDSVADT
jgi:DNA excision repair protein ERCC-4